MGMKTTRLLSALTFCLWANAAAADQTSSGGNIQRYDLSLQPGQHLIIVQAPDRRVIRVNSTQHQTISVNTATGMAPPFIHLEIAKPSITAPTLGRTSSL